jgi:tRNA(Met) C34 N-acetyltransferase TmcA
MWTGVSPCWVGAAFGLTQSLFNFWSRAGYQPVYLRQGLAVV